MLPVVPLMVLIGILIYHKGHQQLKYKKIEKILVGNGQGVAITYIDMLSFVPIKMLVGNG